MNMLNPRNWIALISLAIRVNWYGLTHMHLGACALSYTEGRNLLWYGVVEREPKTGLRKLRPFYQHEHDGKRAAVNLSSWQGAKLGLLLLICGVSFDADANPYGARLVINVPGEALYVWNNPNNCETWLSDFQWDSRTMRVHCYQNHLADEVRPSLPATAHVTYGEEEYTDWSVSTYFDGDADRSSASLWFFRCELVQGFKREYGAPTTEGMRSVQCRGEDVFADGMED